MKAIAILASFIYNPNQNTPGVKKLSNHTEKDVKSKWAAKRPPAVHGIKFMTRLQNIAVACQLHAWT